MKQKIKISPTTFHLIHTRTCCSLETLGLAAHEREYSIWSSATRLNRSPRLFPPQMLKRKLIGRRPKRLRLGSYDEIALPKAETDEQLSDPTLSEGQPGSGSQVLSLPTEVPNDKANAGGSPSLTACGLNSGQSKELVVHINGDAEQLKIAKEMLNTVMNQANAGGSPSLTACGLNAEECIVRIDAEQLKIAKEMLNTIMDQIDLQSFLSSGYSEQQGRCGGSHQSQFSGYGYPQRAPPSFPSQNSQYPPPSSGIYPLPVAPRSNCSPGWDQRPPTSMHGPLSQDKYGKPPPMYNMQQPEGSLPHAQPYGQTNGQCSPQQQSPYAPSEPMQRTNPYPPYGAAPASAGYGQPVAGYGQPPPQKRSIRGYSLFPVPPQKRSIRGYSLFPVPQPPPNNAAAYGYQVPVNPDALAAACAAQLTQAHQPGFYQSGGSGGVAAAAPVVGAQQHQQQQR